MYNKVYRSFDDFLMDRFDMDEHHLRACIEESYAAFHRCNSPDVVIGIYRRKYDEHNRRLSLEGRDLTFREFFEGYYGYTLAEFYEVCDATGMSAKEKAFALEWLKRRWHEHQEKVVPF